MNISASSPLSVSSEGSEDHPSSHQVTEEEWRARKDELHRLYMTENLPLREIMEIFGQRQKMYKSCFKRWGWFKNATKKIRQKLRNGEKIEMAQGPTKRRRRNPKLLRSGGSSRNSSASPRLSHELPALASRIWHASDNLRRIEMLFGNLREIIDASASKNHIWGQVSRFECLPAFGQDLCSQIALASELFATDHTTTGTAVLNKAFAYIGQVAQEEDTFIYGQLFIDIPFVLLDYEQHHILQCYLSHLYGVLNTPEKRCHPIAQIALLMQQITNEDNDKVLESIERLHYIAADRYDAIHHNFNFNSIERRMEAVLFNGADGQSQSDCERVFASFEALLQEAIEEHGEISDTTISMKV
ncbi:hypothetical protein CKAH01_14759 [Colletotrichum kahawae]|uniref:Clr5 domain-containing protein n=1 Tax=Colletotrichum kahawae TaxID=34407 RepID=A0AAE0D9R7_COLKA|nr:hypothetical protein CKAH01_14759 [Colletotrichum kahawae]